jgi:light-regulated signal transduction histidine kinase (bacteriophytochrome)
MAFLDQSEDSVNIAIKTMSDDTGIKETNKNLNSITKTAEDTSKKSDDVASNWKSNMNKVAVATAAVGAGLTLYAKNATDYAVNYVKNARSIARITGDSTEETSRLLAVTNRLGLDTGKVGSIFGIFSKKIAEHRAILIPIASPKKNCKYRLGQLKKQLTIMLTKLKRTVIKLVT